MPKTVDAFCAALLFAFAAGGAFRGDSGRVCLGVPKTEEAHIAALVFGLASTRFSGDAGRVCCRGVPKMELCAISALEEGLGGAGDFGSTGGGVCCRGVPNTEDAWVAALLCPTDDGRPAAGADGGFSYACDKLMLVDLICSAVLFGVGGVAGFSRFGGSG